MLTDKMTMYDSTVLSVRNAKHGQQLHEPLNLIKNHQLGVKWPGVCMMPVKLCLNRKHINCLISDCFFSQFSCPHIFLNFMPVWTGGQSCVLSHSFQMNHCIFSFYVVLLPFSNFSITSRSFNYADLVWCVCVCVLSTNWWEKRISTGRQWL